MFFWQIVCNFFALRPTFRKSAIEFEELERMHKDTKKNLSDLLIFCQPSFRFCCRARMGMSSGAGTSFWAVVARRMSADGTMMV